MISQENLEFISQVSGVSVEKLSGAISNENEVSLDMRLNGRIITQEEERDIRTTATDAGVEIGLKKLAKAGGLDLAPGEKDPEIIIGKIKGSVTSTLEEKYKNMTPSEELQAAKDEVKDWQNKYSRISETYKAKETELDEWSNKYNSLQKEIANKEINNTILKSFPEKMKMDREDALLILRNNFNIEKTDNGLLIKDGDNIVQDPLGNPEKLEKVVSAFVEKKGWVKSRGGMGGSDESGQGGRTYTPDEAVKVVTEKYGNAASPEAIALFNKLTK
jgi:hypothetical protein